MDFPRDDPGQDLELLHILADEIGAYACEQMHSVLALPSGDRDHQCIYRRRVTEYAYDLLRAHSASVKPAPVRAPYVPLDRRDEFVADRRAETNADLAGGED